MTTLLRRLARVIANPLGHHGDYEPHPEDMQKAIAAVNFLGAGAWQPIESAPQDGSEFTVYQNGEYYRAKYSDDPTPRLMFRTHKNLIQSTYRYADAEHEGEIVKAMVPVDEPWKEAFRHDWTFWTRGFDFKPTHWQHIEPPGAS